MRGQLVYAGEYFSHYFEHLVLMGNQWWRDNKCYCTGGCKDGAPWTLSLMAKKKGENRKFTFKMRLLKMHYPEPPANTGYFHGCDGGNSKLVIWTPYIWWPRHVLSKIGIQKGKRKTSLIGTR